MSSLRRASAAAVFSDALSFSISSSLSLVSSSSSTSISRTMSLYSRKSSLLLWSGTAWYLPSAYIIFLILGQEVSPVIGGLDISAKAGRNSTFYGGGEGVPLRRILKSDSALRTVLLTAISSSRAVWTSMNISFLRSGSSTARNTPLSFNSEEIWAQAVSSLISRLLYNFCTHA